MTNSNFDCTQCGYQDSEYSLPFSPAPLSPVQPVSPALSSAALAEPDASSPTPGFLAQSSPSSYPQMSLWREIQTQYKECTVAVSLYTNIGVKCSILLLFPRITYIQENSMPLNHGGIRNSNNCKKLKY